MEKEKIAEFTRRISQSNKSGLTLITYEILFAYLEEAQTACREQEHEVFVQKAQKAKACLNRLMDTLDFQYEIAREVFPIYRFCRDQITMAVIKNESRELEDAGKILKELYESFLEASKEDHSLAQMQNSEKVVAGITYQKNHLTEDYVMGEESRGFLV